MDGVITDYLDKYNKDINVAYLSGVNVRVSLIDAKAAKFSQAFLMASSKLLSAS